MALFQKPPMTPEEIEASRPLELSPEEVVKLDEHEWYARAYRGDHVPQLTWRAIAMGTALGFLLSFTNVYIGLKTGWFLGVALTACILSYAIWSTLRGLGIAKTDMTILENNCMQSTASSAGYSTGNAVISAIPAMMLLTVTEQNPKGTHLAWPILSLWVLFLASLGVVLAIPMKRNMINREKLTFPSGTAAAVTLQGLYSKGDEALKKARALFVAGGLSALVPLVKDLEIVKKTDPATGKVVRDALLPGSSNVFDWIGAVLPASWTNRMLHATGKSFKLSDYQIKLDHSVVLVFAGMIVGMRITTWMVIGGLALAIFITPPALEWPWTNAAGKVVAAAARPGSSWKEIGIWCGAPLLVASGLVSFATQWRTVVRAFTGLAGPKPAAGPFREAAEREGDAPPPPRPEDVEVPTRWFVGGMAAAGVGVVTVAWFAFQIPPYYGALAVVMTFALAIVACRATGESDITPGGAMGKIMQLTYGVLIPQNSTANLMTASVTSNAALASADLLNDLKSGYLLGANPRRQFVAQALGIGTGTIATTLGYFILVPDATVLTGVDGRDPQFPAPAAQQWKAVAEVFKYGLSNLHPMAQSAIKWGVIVGVVLALVETYAPKAWKKWVPSPTGIGLGLILPFFYPLSMFLGALIAWGAGKWNKGWADKYIVPIAAGGIAGESIVGVIVAALNNFVLH